MRLRGGGWFPRQAVTQHHPSTTLGVSGWETQRWSNPTVRKWINQRVRGTAGQACHQLKQETARCYKVLYFLSPFRYHALLHLRERWKTLPTWNLDLCLLITFWKFFLETLRMCHHEEQTFKIVKEVLISFASFSKSNMKGPWKQVSLETFSQLWSWRNCLRSVSSKGSHMGKVTALSA